MKKIAITVAALAIASALSVITILGVNAQTIGPIATALGIVYKNAGTGSVMRTVYSWISDQPIDVLDFATDEIGNGVTDAGPAFRAAIAAACMTGRGSQVVYIPAPRLSYQITTLDSSGLGALVLGDGTNSWTCTLQGAGYTPQVTTLGGVYIKLGPGLNRPLLYARSNLASFKMYHIRLNGNGGNQTGWAGGPGGKLYTMQFEDGGTVEGSVIANDIWVEGGYNGNLYQGSTRGAMHITDAWFLYSGQSTADSNVVLNSYDSYLDRINIGGGTGTGLNVNAGLSLWVNNTAIFSQYVGEVISANVAYVAQTNTLFQTNQTNGLRTTGYTGGGGGTGYGRVCTNCVFDGNSTLSSGTHSDVVATADIHLSLISPTFTTTTGNGTVIPKYNVETASGAVVNVVTPSLTWGSSAATSFTNNYNAIRNTTYGQVVVGSTAPSTTGYRFIIASATQYDGLALSNGTNTTALLTGISASNDAGTLFLRNAGVNKATITASGVSYIGGGAFAIGATSGFTGGNGTFGIAKITTGGSAPGAGFVRIEAVAGTTAGTCKLIAYAGTSTTPTTIADNIGGGC